ncbi:hypothetical protein NOVO_03910 [Rickettsiales bacterium Ac37b]|nr:hypothetical protein NOVO_03910 [Rickettsiales bacterium Ac37b]
MKCSFYCTANAYQVDNLVKFLHSEGFEPKLYDQVIHLQSIEDYDGNSEPRHVFYFAYGCVVFWGFDKTEETSMLNALKAFELEPLSSPITDDCTYIFSPSEDNTYINEEDDEIIFASQDPLIKLSLSYGLSQSVKLIAFETSVDATIARTKYIPEELRIMGRTSLPRKKLAQMIGALFAERNSINLHSDILDTPEFFWRRSRYETYYNIASQYMDIETRLDILNRRLSVIHELYEILSSELQHLHSSRLELIIVWLIAIEIILVLLRDFII